LAQLLHQIAEIFSLPYLEKEGAGLTTGTKSQQSWHLGFMSLAREFNLAFTSSANDKGIKIIVSQ
jgi:hypothetical protein